MEGNRSRLRKCPNCDGVIHYGRPCYSLLLVGNFSVPGAGNPDIMEQNALPVAGVKNPDIME
jgi:hypothetical protein